MTRTRLLLAGLVLLACASAQAQLVDTDDAIRPPIVAQYPLNKSGKVDWSIERNGVVIQPTLEVTFDKPSYVTGSAVREHYTSEVGGYEFDVYGTNGPYRQYDVTFPRPSLGYYSFDGTGDGLHTADIPVPPGDFSLEAVFRLSQAWASESGVYDIVAQTGLGCGSACYSTFCACITGNLICSVSHDGSFVGTVTSVTLAGVCTTGVDHVLGVSFDVDGNLVVCADGECGTAASVGAAYSQTVDYWLGNDFAGAYANVGDIDHFAYWGTTAKGAAWARASWTRYLNGTLHQDTDATSAIHFDRAIAATYASDVGSAVWTVEGNPTYTAGGTNLVTPGAGWFFDRSDDYLTNASVANPIGDISVCSVFWVNGNSNAQDLISKCGADPDYGWSSYVTAFNYTLAVSDNGGTGAGHLSYAQIATTQNTWNFCCASYDYIADGSSVIRTRCNNTAGTPLTTADGPINASTATFGLGSRAGGAIPFGGWKAEDVYWDGVALTDAEMADKYAQWRGVKPSRGLTANVVATSATPPSIQLAPAPSGVQATGPLGPEPFIVKQAANVTQVGSTGRSRGGPFSAKAVINLVWSGSFEGCSGGAEPQWTFGTNAHSAAACDDDFHRADGVMAMYFTSDDSTGTVNASSNCIPVTPAAIYTLITWMYGGAGDESAYPLGYTTYTDGACAEVSTTIRPTSPQNIDVPEQWTKYVWTAAMGGAANSIKVYLNPIGGGDGAEAVWLDAVQFKTGYDTDAYCFTTAAASAVCSTVRLSVAPGLFSDAAVGEVTYTFSTSAQTTTYDYLEFVDPGLCPVEYYTYVNLVFLKATTGGETTFSTNSTPTPILANHEYTVSRSFTPGGYGRSRVTDGGVTTTSGNFTPLRPLTGCNMNLGTWYLGSNDIDGQDRWIHDATVRRVVLP